MLNMFDRAQQLVGTKIFAKSDDKIPCLGICEPVLPVEQNILRMLIKTPKTGFRIPANLSWLAPTIKRCDEYQIKNFGYQPYVYVTVRSGQVKTSADKTWHVDGFSMRIAHRPEQDYIWASHTATEVLKQNIIIPKTFCALTHNIHEYFQDVASPECVDTLKPGLLYAIDPYVVHRRPVITQGSQRTFFRISYLPIPIKDDRNTPNPLIPLPSFGTDDIRTRLKRFE